MSMCIPCRAELYTGMYPVRNGVCWNHTPARSEMQSIVQYLSDLGYRTGIAGKIHASPEEVFPFIKVEGIERNSVSITAKYDSKGISQFINLEKDQPFCLIIALVVPHIPWTVGDLSHFNPDRLKLPPYLADTPETRENYAKYLAEIEVLDQQVGMTLEVLEESGMANNTIVIFTSEQGAQFPGCKWTNWNTGIHTGFIVRWPGKVKPGKRTDALIQYADILPTLIDAAGGNSKIDFDGSSFLSVLLGNTNKHRQYAFFMHNNVPEGPPYPIRSITDGEYHYIFNLQHENLYIEKHLMGRMPLNQYWPSWLFNSDNDKHILSLVTRYMLRPEEELYRIDTDPYEIDNRAYDPDLLSVKNRLKEKLDQWMNNQGDPSVLIDTREQWQSAKKGNHFENKNK